MASGRDKKQVIANSNSERGIYNGENSFAILER